MSQCVPSWDLDENYPNNCRASLRSRSNSTAPDVPMYVLSLCACVYVTVC